jgi:ABC-type multidrug transport system fused ATPase/permease subunit
VGIVLQDVFVFAGTWRDNIAWGADEATMEDVVRAARVAQLHEFIQGQPQGYDTLIGEKGTDLSGGERQRLAIARTILVDPPILVLDDSTSSVDMGTEHLIQTALADVIGDRTTFVISHRLTTVRQADVILVLDKGEIVERGAHDELLALGGLYRRMHDLQLAPTVEEALVEGHGAASGGRPR